MSVIPNTASISSNFEALFNAALAKYAQQTGNDLRNHPLAHKIDICDSPDSFLRVFQEQAQKFDEFRNGHHSLIKWLQPVVTRIHALSTSATVSSVASAVRPNNFIAFFLSYQTFLSCNLGDSPCIGNIFWDKCPSLCAYLLHSTAVSDIQNH